MQSDQAEFLILYNETQFKEPDSDDEKQRLIYYAQSKEYAGLQMDLSNLMRTSLERSVVERMRKLEQELFQRGEYLNDATEEVFGKICDEILKVKGKDVWERIHSARSHIESDGAEDSQQSDDKRWETSALQSLLITKHKKPEVDAEGEKQKAE